MTDTHPTDDEAEVRTFAGRLFASADTDEPTPGDEGLTVTRQLFGTTRPTTDTQEKP